MAKISRYISGIALTVLVAMVLLISSNIGERANACSGPNVIASVSPTQININESVTVTGQVYPFNPNATVRVTFVRPNLSWVDTYATVDNTTGKFTDTLKLDAYGFWTIYAIHDAMNDRLFVDVVSPPNSSPQPTPIVNNPAEPSVLVVGVALVIIIGGAVAVAKIVRDKKRKVTSARVFVQIGALFFLFLGVFVNYNGLPQLPFATLSDHDYLIGTNLAGLPNPDGLSVPTFGCYYGCGRTVTCALWQIQAYIFPLWNSGHGWGVNYVLPGIERLGIVLGLVVLMSLILGRIFCGWVCPFGLYVDFVSWIRKTLKFNHKNLSEKNGEKIRQLRYVIIAAILIVSFILGAEAITGTLIVPSTQTGGYAYTYLSSPFCQVCPMKPLCVWILTVLGPMRPAQILSTTTGQFLQLGYYITSLNLLVLGIVTVAAFVFRRSWCRICPLGGIIAVFSNFPPFKYISVTRLEKTETKCTKCGICKRVCPTQVTKVYKEKGGNVNDSACVMCLRCVEMCPEESCLKVKMAGKTVFESRNWLE
ncbi:MAG: 4Fe-4S binding protein [Candidatus Bathyarchaeia archaeon]|jgi:polyferredoxin